MAYFTLYSQRMGTFRRLPGFLWAPNRRKLIVSLVLVWLAMAMTVAIPADIIHLKHKVDYVLEM